MSKDSSSKGKVIAFAAGRKSAPSMVEAKATGTTQPKPFLETWLKGHEDSQSLVKENLSLKKQQRRLEQERDSLIPSLSEHTLYYVLIALGLVYLIGWMTTAVVRGVSA